MKSCIAEKPNSVDQVDVQKSQMHWKLTVCGTDESQQKIFNNLNKNDSFVPHELIWLIFFICSLTSSIHCTGGL